MTRKNGKRLFSESYPQGATRAPGEGGIYERSELSFRRTDDET